MRQARASVNVKKRAGGKFCDPRTPRAMSIAMRLRARACFSFDNMAEAADVGAGRRDGPLPIGTDASLTEGFPRLYAMLARHDVRATFFVEGWNGIHPPEAVAQIVRRGHELGMHGWAHEPWAALAPADERALAERATAALAAAAGVQPRGFRAPGGVRSDATERVLCALGYDYDASLGDHVRPHRLPSGLAQIPFVWPAVDGFHYLRPEPAAPETVRDRWLAELARVAEGRGLFLLVCHAFISGVDERRLAALEAVVAAAAHDPRIDVTTMGDLAAEIRAQEDR
jgi:peptidoglycan/xylan/chitin deacetylase (PgdA/CDA1 family)